ncbi:MAG: hypothetical protein U1F65_03260 [Verrucomicrobiota bacterium]
MKKLLLTALAVSLAAATQVGALTVTVTQISGYSTGTGGEFNVNPITGVGYAPSVIIGGGFETFCIAKNVGITIPGTYSATVNADGVYVTDYSGGTKTLSLGTAYLYQQFATGVLAGYHYNDIIGGAGSGRALDAQMLQLAIWNLEGTYTYLGGDVTALTNPFIALAANQFGGGLAGLAAARAANGAGGFGVGALNLTGDGTTLPRGTPVQSMLILLPDGGTTLMLMGIGFSSLALISRKFRA